MAEGGRVTPAALRHLADRIAKDTRFGRVARLTTAAILEGVAAQMERGEW